MSMLHNFVVVALEHVISDFLGGACDTRMVLLDPAVAMPTFKPDLQLGSQPPRLI